MIIKIERHLDEQKWWLVDNIAKVSCSEKLYDNKVSPEILIMDHEKTCSCDGVTEQCSECRGYYILVCRTKDYDEFSIAFDTIAYICNDEGKTIEKIVANYTE